MITRQDIQDAEEEVERLNCLLGEVEGFHNEEARARFKDELEYAVAEAAKVLDGRLRDKKLDDAIH